MNEPELIALIESEEANCISAYTGVLAEQRRKAMAYYYGQPYGNEVEGRSQIVTTEVKEAVEDIMPALMKIFTASGEIVRCEPTKPQDEEAASQATDYLHHVFWEKNPGFLLLYCLFKDALLQKNGYAKVYWEDYQDNGKETYEGLSDMQFQSLLQDPELELAEHTESVDEEAAKAMAQKLAPIIQSGAQIPQMPQPMLHDAVFRRSKKYGRTCAEPCPPEEILISRETPNQLTKARFTEHRTLKTISEIRKMGYDIEDDIADFAPNADFNLERVERNKFDDALAYRTDQASTDPTTRRVWFCEAYLYVDFDGDGIAEFRKVSKVGREILDNEEFDSLPILGGTAVLMPHKHYGLSIFDLIGDIQLIKSTITRQLLDNAYVANNGRMMALDGMVNMDDLLTSRPNGVVRVKAMGALQRIEQPLLGPGFYGLLEYFDKLKQQRTGSTGFPNAVDPDAINAKAAFVDKFAEAAMERIGLMARILAETVVKPIFEKFLELESKHQQKSQMVKLRGKWIEVNPREWANKFSITISVGLGTGSQAQVLQGATTIMQAQIEMAKLGLSGRVVTEKNFYESLRRIAKVYFPKDMDAFATDPSSLPPAQPQPNPDLMKLQQKEASDQRKLKQRYDKMQVDTMLKIKEMAQQHGIALADLSLSAAELAQGSAMHKRDLIHEHTQGERDRQVQLADSHIQADNQRQIAKERPQV